MCVRISEELFSPPPEMAHESLIDLAAWKAAAWGGSLGYEETGCTPAS